MLRSCCACGLLSKAKYRCPRAPLRVGHPPRPGALRTVARRTRSASVPGRSLVGKREQMQGDACMRGRTLSPPGHHRFQDPRRTVSSFLQPKRVAFTPPPLNTRLRGPRRAAWDEAATSWGLGTRHCAPAMLCGSKLGTFRLILGLSQYVILHSEDELWRSTSP